MKYCSYLTLFSVCLFTGCASMNGYCPNPNDTPTQSVLRFTGAMINAVNQSITGYSINGTTTNQDQGVVEAPSSVATTPVIATSEITSSQSNVDVGAVTQLKVVKKEGDLETIVVPSQYIPPPSYDPNLVIVIQP